MLKICQNASESTDGPLWSRAFMSSVILYFTNPSAAFFITCDKQVWRTVPSTTVRRGSPFHNTYTYWNFGIELASDHHDEPEGWTIVSMTVRHELFNLRLSSNFSIFLHQLHYDATYGPSEAWRTMTSSVGGNFFAFHAQKLPRSSLDRIPANKDKLT